MSQNQPEGNGQHACRPGLADIQEPVHLPLPTVGSQTWGFPPNRPELFQVAGRAPFAEDRFRYALRAIVRCESCASLLRVGVQNDVHPLPQRLLASGHPTWALLWDVMHECWRQYQSMPDRELVAMTIRELAASGTYEGASADEALALLRHCSDGEPPNARAGKEIVAELLRHFLVDLPRGEAWTDWHTNDGLHPGAIEQRIAIIEQELTRALRYGDEPEGPLTDDELCALTQDNVELVQGVLVARQPAIIGGPQKTLKTLLGLDMALSLATGAPWLGNPNWTTGQSHRVAFYSGESGGRVLLAKRRVMQHVKRQGLPPEQQRQFDEALGANNFMWGTRRSDLPDFSDAVSIERWRRRIMSRGVEVVFVDPVLLCLGSAAKDLANSSATGQRIIEAVDALQTEGVTVVLLHHTAGDRTRRFNGIDREPLELSDLAYPGITQFMRQWVTVNRADAYQQETRCSTLWLNIGGSGMQAGGVFRAVITEGRNHDMWQVHVESRSHYEERERMGREFQDREESRNARSRVLQFIRANPGTTLNRMTRNRDCLAGLGESTLGGILPELERERSITSCQDGNATRYYISDQNSERRDVTDDGGADMGGNSDGE